MQRRDIAQSIADALFEAEGAVDMALEKAALFIALTSSLRRDHDFSAVLGHDGVAAVARSVDTLGQTRTHLMAAHAALAAAAPEIGVRPATLHGTGVSKPERNGIVPTAEVPAPRIVA
ncbi:hypothetical protein FJQ54_12565 [Sandaracinobacter neustonicus]|uniref:Uncharacterized protein n=1 Tax=Sandaracinobacter neustonicus TaxID=1715348 RepID=A0A501XHI0_9SPHN|nr:MULTISPECIES: hypothetical protein [Alphaproteobacteria]TPE59764.1 hypothetical protein FJQ54_12565 [Sandaracinobacter neustonicus]HBI20668.1 hypothetical protein [Brevundimonas sp.]